jgi:hypothetical protein
MNRVEYRHQQMIGSNSAKKNTRNTVKKKAIWIWNNNKELWDIKIKNKQVVMNNRCKNRKAKHAYKTAKAYRELCMPSYHRVYISYNQRNGWSTSLGKHTDSKMWKATQTCASAQLGTHACTCAHTHTQRKSQQYQTSTELSSITPKHILSNKWHTHSTNPTPWKHTHQWSI